MSHPYELEIKINTTHSSTGGEINNNDFLGRIEIYNAAAMSLNLGNFTITVQLKG